MLHFPEDQLRIFLDHISAACFITDVDGTVVRANRASEQLIGLGHLAAVGRNLFEDLLPTRKTSQGREFLAGLEPKISGRSEHHIINLLPSNDQSTELHLRAQLLQSDHEPLFLILVESAKDQNVAERTKEEPEAASATATDPKFRTIFDAEPECVKLLDRYGNLLDMNAAGLAIIEVDSLEEVRGQCIYDIVNEKHRAAFINANEKSFEGVASRLQFQIVSMKGRQRWMDSHVVPLKNTGEEITASLSVTREITDIRQTEQQLRLTQFAVDAAVEGIFWMRPEDGSLEYVNESACNTLGYSREELLQLRFSDIDRSVSTSNWLELADTIVQKGRHGHESMQICKSGRQYPVDTVFNHLRFDGRDLFCAHVRDVTTRKLAEEALVETTSGIQQSERRFRSIFEQAGMAVGLLESKTGRFIQVNEKYVSLIGYSHEELAKLTWMDITHPEDLAADSGNMQRILQGDIQNFTLEKRLIRKDGSPRWVNLTISPTWGPDDTPDLHIAIVEDISERKEAEANNRRLQAHLSHKQKMEAIGQLAAGIAHEFNNLLLAIGGNVEAILLTENKTLSARATQSLKEVERATDRAATLTKQMLSFAAKKSPDLSICDLGYIVENCEPMLRRLLGQKVDLTLDLSAESVHARANEYELEQSLLNLVLNARDALSGGGELVLRTDTIAITEEEVLGGENSGAFARLTVSDNGCGMNSETLRRAFEPFFTTKPVGQGTGLGLATVYSDASKYGGFVWVESEEGRGTQIQMCLPLSTETPKFPRRMDQAMDVCGNETILVCDDEEIVLSAVCSLLEGAGYSVLAARSAAEAINIAEQEDGKIDLLFTDVTMPDFDGFELGRKLRDRFPTIKVIYSSGYTADRLTRSEKDEMDFFQKGKSGREMLLQIRRRLDLN
ncbi:MAG: PAS domain S-box protein [Planctomycetota bacterium]